MDITDFRSIATVLCFIAMAGVFYWTYHPSRKKIYDDAAKLPFSDDDDIKPLSQTQKSQAEQSPSGAEQSNVGENK